MSCIETDVLPWNWAYIMTHQRWVEHISLVLVWTVTFSLKNEATSHIEFILPYLCWVWMKLRQIIHGVWYCNHEQWRIHRGGGGAEGTFAPPPPKIRKKKETKCSNFAIYSYLVAKNAIFSWLASLASVFSTILSKFT